MHHLLNYRNISRLVPFETCDFFSLCLLLPVSVLLVGTKFSRAETSIVSRPVNSLSKDPGIHSRKSFPTDCKPSLVSVQQFRNQDLKLLCLVQCFPNWGLDSEKGPKAAWKLEKIGGVDRNKVTGRSSTLYSQTVL